MSTTAELINTLKIEIDNTYTRGYINGKAEGGATEEQLKKIQAFENLNAFYMGETTAFNNPYITELQDQTFRNNSIITSVTCSNLQKVGSYAFGNASNLTKIDMSNLKETGEFAFYGSKKVTTIICPNLITAGNSTFRDCELLSSLNIPNIQTGGAQVFRGCKAITTLDLYNIESLGSYAFYDMDNLTTLILRGATLCTLGGTGFNAANQLASDGIYVKDDLVETYKTANNWKAMKDYIKGLSELPTN